MKKQRKYEFRVKETRRNGHFFGVFACLCVSACTFLIPMVHGSKPCNPSVDAKFRKNLEWLTYRYVISE